jgi:hypothetical protein
MRQEFIRLKPCSSGRFVLVGVPKVAAWVMDDAWPSTFPEIVGWEMHIFFLECRFNKTKAALIAGGGAV